MLCEPQILSARVFHARLRPKRNAFSYRVYYLALDIDALDRKCRSLSRAGLGFGRFALHSINSRDHGARDGSSLRVWAEQHLANAGVDEKPRRIVLVTLPRVLGFVFNPVSFWFCQDGKDQTLAVISEVNNTFGQTRAYVCSTPEGLSGPRGQRWQHDKDFLVSPFLQPEGRYRFGFALSAAKMGVTIDLDDGHGKGVLTTRLSGRFYRLSRPALWAAFVRHPMVTAKVVALIHWQAAKLLAKGIRFLGGPSAYVSDPMQERTSNHGPHA